MDIDRVLTDPLGQTVSADERESLHGGHTRRTSVVNVLAALHVARREQSHIPAIGIGE